MFGTVKVAISCPAVNADEVAAYVVPSIAKVRAAATLLS